MAHNGPVSTLELSGPHLDLADVEPSDDLTELLVHEPGPGEFNVLDQQPGRRKLKGRN